MSPVKTEHTKKEIQLDLVQHNCNSVLPQLHLNKDRISDTQVINLTVSNVIN